MPRSLLVTGAAGFIGANFVHYWMQQHPDDRVVAYDALTYAGNRANLAPLAGNENFSFVHADICDYPAVLRTLSEHAVDTLVHFAAESHVDRSITGPDAFIETNIVGTHTLLKAAKKRWLDGGKTKHRFHHLSTDEVYGTLGPDDPPFTELTPYAPNSPYAASKASSDHLVRAYHETYGLNTTISNCSNNYGPFQFPEKLIPLVIINILFNKPLPIYGDGRQIRDWLYVEDHNRGVDLILEKGIPGRTYNIGGTNEWANIDIVHLICDLLLEQFSTDKRLADRFADSPAAQAKHPDTLICHVKDRAGHDRRYAINTTKIKNDLGFLPEESFETGIRKTLRWFLDHQPWWNALLNDSYKAWLATNYS